MAFRTEEITPPYVLPQLPVSDDPYTRYHLQFFVDKRPCDEAKNSQHARGVTRALQFSSSKRGGLGAQMHASAMLRVVQDSFSCNLCRPQESCPIRSTVLRYQVCTYTPAAALGCIYICIHIILIVRFVFANATFAILTIRMYLVSYDLT